MFKKFSVKESPYINIKNSKAQEIPPSNTTTRERFLTDICTNTNSLKLRKRPLQDCQRFWSRSVTDMLPHHYLGFVKIKFWG